MYRIGIDVGSTRTKYAVIDEDGHILQFFAEKTPVRQREYFSNKVKELQSKYFENVIESCGYGKENVESLNQVNELLALARGVFQVYGDDAYVLDIGGQDTKLILEQQGRLKKFFVNNKCAAGCGQFLTNVLNMLEVSFDELDIREIEEPNSKLSSVCAVFAQTEIVGLVASGCLSEKEIILRVIWQILTQAKDLLSKVDCKEILLTGGMSQIPGIDRLAEKVFGIKVLIPEYSIYLSAIGCVL